MGELVAVVPLYKADLEFAGEIADATARLVDADVTFDLARDGGADDLTVQHLLDVAAALGVDAAGALITERAGHVTVSGRGVNELSGRPEAAEVLTEIAEVVCESGKTCVVLTPWWIASESNRAAFERLLECCHRAVGVLDAPLQESSSSSYATPEQRAATDLMAATPSRVTFVVRRRSEPIDVLLPPFDDTSRTVTLTRGQSASEATPAGRLAALLDVARLEVPSSPTDLAGALAGFGLTDVFVPDGLARELRAIPFPGTGAVYAFGTRPFSADEAYQFDPVVEPLLSGDRTPRLEVSAAGHGINSWAHCYTLVTPGLAVIAQVGFGALTDPVQVTTSWAALMSQVASLHAAVARDPLPEGQMLTVVSSDIRGVHAVGLLGTASALDDQRGSLTSSSHPFDDAHRLLPRPDTAATELLVPAPTVSAREQVADLWDHVLAEWMNGREVWTEPGHDDLARWFASYAAPVDLQYYPDPYVGDLRGQQQPPKLVLMGLNPGRAHASLQARGGIWAEGIRLRGYSHFHDRIPLDNSVWTAADGKDSEYWRKVTYFARRWCGEPELSPSEILNLELYPWHSDRVTAPIRPPSDVLTRYVWDPLAEVDVPVAFAFGKPWLAAAEGIGLHRVAWLGDHSDAQAPLSMKSWNVVVFRLPSTQHLVVSWQTGSGSPPGASRIPELRAVLDDLGLDPYQVTAGRTRP